MSSADRAPAMSQPMTAPQEITDAGGPDSQRPLSSTPVEMRSFSSKSAMKSTSPPSSSAQARNASASASDLSKENSPAKSHPESHQKFNRAYSAAIGPSSDQPMSIPKDDCTGPTLMITLLLTTGARHPFKIDSKYLLKRNVDVQGNDPFNLSVYKLKELILREWRDGMARLSNVTRNIDADLQCRMGGKTIKSKRDTTYIVWETT
jgi:hypothetical protein